MMMARCYLCGRFMRTFNNTRPIGWFAYGEYGEEEGHVCSDCVLTWTPRDGRGRGTEAGYCGIKQPVVPHPTTTTDVRGGKP